METTNQKNSQKCLTTKTASPKATEKDTRPAAATKQTSGKQKRTTVMIATKNAIPESTATKTVPIKNSCTSIEHALECLEAEENREYWAEGELLNGLALAITLSAAHALTSFCWQMF